jgi:hypothetical protein
MDRGCLGMSHRVIGIIIILFFFSSTVIFFEAHIEMERASRCGE